MLSMVWAHIPLKEAKHSEAHPPKPFQEKDTNNMVQKSNVRKNIRCLVDIAT